MGEKVRKEMILIKNFIFIMMKSDVLNLDGMRDYIVVILLDQNFDIWHKNFILISSINLTIRTWQLKREIIISE